MRLDSFRALSRLRVGGKELAYHRLAALEAAGVGEVSRLPFTLKVLLENLLRCEDGRAVTADDICALAAWRPKEGAEREIAFTPARVLLQDFTGVPVVVDLASMRQAVRRLGGDPGRINPLQPVDLVIDHSVQVDVFGTLDAFERNVAIELERNRERYAFLRWGQQAFANFRVVPPGTGICHQVNLEYLATVVFRREENGAVSVYPDTLVGTDSHTTMVNGLGVLGWGVGGIEAEAAMLGQPISMLIPDVVGVRLTGELAPEATATDLVLTITQMLRKHGVVGKFVEFTGPGVARLALAARATIANMSPEYGATCGFFPVDDETLNYLRFTGRDAELVELVERYCREQGLFREAGAPEPVFSDLLELDLGSVEPSIAGPRRPQDRVPLGRAKVGWRESLLALVGGKEGIDFARPERWLAGEDSPPGDDTGEVERAVEEGTSPLGSLLDGQVIGRAGKTFRIEHGSVVIAAITSCTNTSNPEVMLGAGLVAKKAVERGLTTKPWVKTSLAPGSQVVTDYLREAGLTPYLDALGFQLTGYGCTTCIGNSGPLDPDIAEAIHRGKLVAASVLSGNRNFEGRIHPDVRANYLASPPLVVAYALAGRMDVDLAKEPIGRDRSGKPVTLRDLWPTQAEVDEVVRAFVRSEMFVRRYGSVFQGDDSWAGLDVPSGELFAWDDASTYVRNPPFFEDLRLEPAPLADIEAARVLVMLGDSVTTDHISPAGSIKAEGPAGRYLIEHGVAKSDFNSYGSRRGNHEVMMRGTFANVRLRNQLAPDTEGGVTIHLPGGAAMSIYDAAMRYREEKVPLVVLAGKEYGAGSSRDWAAKGTALLGVRAVVAESYERIHRSNLVGMGVLPLQYLPGESGKLVGFTGRERFVIRGIGEGLSPGKRITVTATDESGAERAFSTIARIDTPVELDYYRNGGILPFVLRQILG